MSGEKGICWNNKERTVIKVCDAIMGSGKTESAITAMNEDTESRYIFITPYLDEVDRIKQRCADRHFKSPANWGKGKLDSLHELLARRENVASTHALFSSYNRDTMLLIKNGGYKLIMDEVSVPLHTMPVSANDVQMLKDSGYITVDKDKRVRWVNDKYKGSFSDLRSMCDSGNVTIYRGSVLIWGFPVEIFKAFRDVIVLTYMFTAQVQKYYFDVNKVGVKYIGVEWDGDTYRFCETPCGSEHLIGIKDKIHISEDRKLNMIGDVETSLSVSWYAKAKKAPKKPNLERMRKNLLNFFRNKLKSASSETLWTTFKECQDSISGKGYVRGFLSCNMRATNSYRERDKLAYCLNVYYNPILKNYFHERGVDVDEDAYALSEMVQWVWRSAIRDGKEIWLYIPSSRMRGLFTDWLDKVSTGIEDQTA